MRDEQDDRPDESEGRSSAAPLASPKPCHEVVVTHLDSPPPSGRQSIHPRRPAPIVPTREQRTGEPSAHETDSKQSSRE